jgi:hypothetical protein
MHFAHPNENFQSLQSSAMPAAYLFEDPSNSVISLASDWAAADILRLYGEDTLTGVITTVCEVVEITSLLRTKWRTNGAVAMLSAEATVIAYICMAIPFL